MLSRLQRSLEKIQNCWISAGDAFTKYSAQLLYEALWFVSVFLFSRLHILLVYVAFAFFHLKIHLWLLRLTFMFNYLDFAFQRLDDELTISTVLLFLRLATSGGVGDKKLLALLRLWQWLSDVAVLMSVWVSSFYIGQYSLSGSVQLERLSQIFTQDMDLHSSSLDNPSDKRQHSWMSWCSVLSSRVAL